MPPTNPEHIELPSATLEDALQSARQRLGSILVTVTVLTPDAAEISRVASTHPDVYDVGGRKYLDPTHTSPLWLTQVIEQQRPFVGETRTEVREFFVDWETIESLGCGAIINTPVLHGTETIGSINFLGPEGSLDETSVATALEITAGVTAAVVAARLATFPELAI